MRALNINENQPYIYTLHYHDLPTVYFRWKKHPTNNKSYICFEHLFASKWYIDRYIKIWHTILTNMIFQSNGIVCIAIILCKITNYKSLNHSWDQQNVGQDIILCIDRLRSSAIATWATCITTTLKLRSCKGDDQRKYHLKKGTY